MKNALLFVRCCPRSTLIYPVCSLLCRMPPERSRALDRQKLMRQKRHRDNNLDQTNPASRRQALLFGLGSKRMLMRERTKALRLEERSGLPTVVEQSH